MLFYEPLEFRFKSKNCFMIPSPGPRRHQLSSSSYSASSQSFDLNLFSFTFNDLSWRLGWVVIKKIGDVGAWPQDHVAVLDWSQNLYTVLLFCDCKLCKQEML